jgi:diguanylate cyclase (GGDEF)-like protein
VHEASHLNNDFGAGRLTIRRGVALVASLLAASAIVFVLGSAYVWPVFIFPLFLAAVFFFELGSLAVTAWLGAFFVAYYSLREPATAALTKEAIAGMPLYALAGMLLGRVQRNHNALQVLLAASSLTDRLTGLYNYGTFVDYLHNEITKVDRYGGELTLIMFDIDHFKQFNDHNGHEAGNDLLRRVGATLRGLVRESDMAARYGGEEFTLLIRGDESHGYDLAERIRRAVETIAMELHAGSEVFATISGGVAQYVGGSGDETDLIERADASLYESKRRGRNRITSHSGAAEREFAATLSA